LQSSRSLPGLGLLVAREEVGYWLPRQVATLFAQFNFSGMHLTQVATIYCGGPGRSTHSQFCSFAIGSQMTPRAVPAK
jgi:hypothetical protein